jgi:hypothetical protein
MNSSPTTLILPAEEWFQQGDRVLYDPARKRIVQEETPTSVHVWERVVAPIEPSSTTRWLTLLPTPPDGSYSYAKVDGLIQTSPRLYVDFVGQGDSDKPNNYAHSTMDRADLVEAQWKAHKIRRTVLVCMGCSSMAMMELLNRQTKRISLGLPLRTRIEHILCINGGYFASAHTPHPLNACPIVRNTVGKATMKAAQHSNIVLDPIVRQCFAKDYDLSKYELREVGNAIRRRNGTNYFTGSATRYIEEHKKYAQRWDLLNVYHMTRRQAVSFTLIGSKKDRFETKSFQMAQARLRGLDDVFLVKLEGGFKVASEEPHRVADLIDASAMAPAFSDSEYAHHRQHKRISMSSSQSTAETTLGSSSSSCSASSAWDADFAHMEYELPSL